VSGGRGHLEARLTEGYAQAHALERAALRIQRQCDELLARDGDPRDLSAALIRRQGIETELAALRRRLAEDRAVG
jgi:hypothetical protein